MVYRDLGSLGVSSVDKVEAKDCETVEFRGRA